MGSGGRQLWKYIFDFPNGFSGKLIHRLRMLLGFERKRNTLDAQSTLSHFDFRITFLYLPDLNVLNLHSKTETTDETLHNSRVSLFIFNNGRRLSADPSRTLPRPTRNLRWNIYISDRRDPSYEFKKNYQLLLNRCHLVRFVFSLVWRWRLSNSRFAS